MNTTSLSGPERFARVLASAGITGPVQHLPDSTRTAAEAATAIGCEVSEIAKSIVFRNPQTDTAIIVVASGSNRVDTAKLGALIGCRPARAAADFVRRQTGFAIGGVPPFGYPEPLPTFIDEDLFSFERVWAAAGGPFAVYATTADELLTAGDGMRADIKLQNR